MTEEKAEKKSSKCGHENKHYVAHKDVKEKRLFCTLPADHEGNHSAEYQTWRNGALRDATAAWSAAAGTPVVKQQIEA